MLDQHLASSQSAVLQLTLTVAGYGDFCTCSGKSNTPTQEKLLSILVRHLYLTKICYSFIFEVYFYQFVTFQL